MKLNVSVDLENFMEIFNGETLEQLLADTVKDEILKIVKRDTRYKVYIQQKANDFLSGIKT